MHVKDRFYFVYLQYKSFTPPHPSPPPQKDGIPSKSEKRILGVTRTRLTNEHASRYIANTC